jgi:hypothetical protein
MMLKKLSIPLFLNQEPIFDLQEVVLSSFLFLQYWPSHIYWLEIHLIFPLSNLLEDIHNNATIKLEFLLRNSYIL